MNSNKDKSIAEEVANFYNPIFCSFFLRKVRKERNISKKTNIKNVSFKDNQGSKKEKTAINSCLSWMIVCVCQRNLSKILTNCDGGNRRKSLKNRILHELFQPYLFLVSWRVAWGGDSTVIK